MICRVLLLFTFGLFSIFVYNIKAQSNDRGVGAKSVRAYEARSNERADGDSFLCH